MKLKTLSTLFFTLGLTLYGCGAAPSTTAPTAPTEFSVVQDRAGLIAALQAAGASVEIADSVSQDFFSPEGSLVRVNGGDLQVFEYENAAAMEEEAAQVAPDGGSVGTSMMMWVDAPHFYKSGRIIVLYVGSDENTLNLLENAIGVQFAGR